MTPQKNVNNIHSLCEAPEKQNSDRILDYGDVSKILFRVPDEQIFESPEVIKAKPLIESSRHLESTAYQTHRSPGESASKFLFTDDNNKCWETSKIIIENNSERQDHLMMDIQSL